jgi:PAS domain S-box-containing protein
MAEQHDQTRIIRRLLWACNETGRLTELDRRLQAWLGCSLLDAFVIADPDRSLAKIFNERNTLSGVPTRWCREGQPILDLTLSGLPKYNIAGDFIGYHGFALLRELVDMTREDTAPSLPPPSPAPQKPPPSIVDLTEREQQAFHEIGRLLAEDVMPKIFKDQTAIAAQDPLLDATASDLQGDEDSEDDASLPNTQSGASSDPLDPLMDELAASVLAMHGAVSERKPSDMFSVPQDVQALLDRLPVGVLVSRGDVPIVMNKMILHRLGYESADDFHEAGAIHDLFAQQPLSGMDAEVEASTLLQIRTRTGDTVSMRVMFQTLSWGYLPASMMVFVPADLSTAAQEPQASMPEPEVIYQQVMVPDEAMVQRLGELEAILDTATDGVVVLDGDGMILSLNSSAQALFGYDAQELTSVSYLTLFAPESQMIVRDYLEGVRENGVRSLMNDGREVLGLERQGRSMPLFMTLGRTSMQGSGRFCAVLRDLTAWKKAESDLKESRRQAELANAQKSDTLARISHELRTPLSAIMGFAEVMVEERFGPVGNDRYRDYLRDIHQSGQHLLSLVNDLLDLAKIEAGKFDLDFVAVDANATVRAALAMIRPEAERHHVFLRSALASSLPMVVADERTIRQVVINLLSNAVKFTEPGGQVIVTTTLSDDGEVALRIRDTGVGMDSDDLKMALELFRQTAAGRKAGGTGLGLPLTKALAEANRARFAIKSERGRGTLVEIIFPANRVLVT